MNALLQDALGRLLFDLNDEAALLAVGSFLLWLNNRAT
jgi:hypothetical protein